MYLSNLFRFDLVLCWLFTTHVVAPWLLVGAQDAGKLVQDTGSVDEDETKRIVALPQDCFFI